MEGAGQRGQSAAELLQCLDAVSVAPRFAECLARRQQQPLEYIERPLSGALQQLSELGAVTAPHQINWEVQDWLKRYQEAQRAEQQLSALVARQRTLRLQLRNLDKELERRSLFGNKKKQLEALRYQEVSGQLQGVREEHNLLQRSVDQIQLLTQQVITRFDQEEELKKARWYRGQICWLSEVGLFLQETLHRFGAAKATTLSLSALLQRGVSPS